MPSRRAVRVTFPDSAPSAAHRMSRAACSFKAWYVSNLDTVLMWWQAYKKPHDDVKC